MVGIEVLEERDRSPFAGGYRFTAQSSGSGLEVACLLEKAAQLNILLRRLDLLVEVCSRGLVRGREPNRLRF